MIFPENWKTHLKSIEEIMCPDSISTESYKSIYERENNVNLLEIEKVSSVKGPKRNKEFYAYKSALNNAFQHHWMLSYDWIKYMENGLFKDTQTHKINSRIIIPDETVFQDIPLKTGITKNIVCFSALFKQPCNPDVKDYITYIEKENSLFPLCISNKYMYTSYYNAGPSQKVWYIIPPSEREKMNDVFIELFPNELCHNILQHRDIFPSVDFLNFHQIKFQRLVQSANEMIVIFPGTYYCGFSTGYMLSDTTQFFQCELIQLFKQLLTEDLTLAFRGTDMCHTCNERIIRNQLHIPEGEFPENDVIGLNNTPAETTTTATQTTMHKPTTSIAAKPPRLAHIPTQTTSIPTTSRAHTFAKVNKVQAIRKAPGSQKQRNKPNKPQSSMLPAYKVMRALYAKSKLPQKYKMKEINQMRKRAGTPSKPSTSTNVKVQNKTDKRKGKKVSQSNEKSSRNIQNEVINLCNENIMPIAHLNPYQASWLIKVRVISKRPIHNYNNSKGNGRLFSMHLKDSSAEIRATAFNNLVDRHFDNIEMNKIYLISNGVIKNANQLYSNLKNNFEIIFNESTIIQEIQDDEEEENNIPQFSTAVVPMNNILLDIAQIKKSVLSDPVSIAAIIFNVDGVQSIFKQKTNQEFKIRNVTLTDLTEDVIALTLWNDEAENFNGKTGDVLLISNAMIKEYHNMRTIKYTNGTTIFRNPDIPAEHKLKQWFQNNGQKAVFKKITNMALNNISNQ